MGWQEGEEGGVPVARRLVPAGPAVRSPPAGDQPPGHYRPVPALSPRGAKAGPLTLAAERPVVVGRSSSTSIDGRELMDPRLRALRTVGVGAETLLVTARSTSSGNASRSFTSVDGGGGWAELNSSLRVPDGGVPTDALNCVPPTAGGTLCFTSPALEFDPSQRQGGALPRRGLLRGAVFSADARGRVSWAPHPPAPVDMSNCTRNMTVQAGSNLTSFVVTGPAVSDGAGGLLMLLIGQFDGAAPPPPKTAPPTSLVTISSTTNGRSWVFRSEVPLKPSAGAGLSVGAASPAPAPPPTCDPTCPKGTVCKELDSKTGAYGCVCEPACKTGEECGGGICRPIPRTLCEYSNDRHGLLTVARL